MSNSNASGRRRRRLCAAGISAALIVTPQVQAFERVIIGIDHFVDCAGLLLSNPRAHAENCLPNRVKPNFDSLVSSNSDGLVVAPPAPPTGGGGPAGCGPAGCGGPI